MSPGPFGSEFRPTNPAELYVSNAHGGPNVGSVSAYNVKANGVLDPIGGSPFADKQTAPCWVEITPDGKYLFFTSERSPFTVPTAHRLNYDEIETVLHSTLNGHGNIFFISSEALDIHETGGWK